ncbi:MAG: FecR domain-containing protein [Mediterranea sp.]|jgi:ferric-dicitrate binding protein FerR (iron transport regulator)|nr:FecR domain-containing protein [Mediterranea sp.]
MDWYKLKRMNDFAAGCDTEAAWRQVWGRIERRSRMRLYRRWAGVAAVLAVAVGAGWWYLRTPVPPRFDERGRQEATLTTAGQERYMLYAGTNTVIGTDQGLRLAWSTHGELDYQARQPQADTLKDVGRHRLEVPRGGEYKLLLADGTRIHLNAESRLSYPPVFVGSRREVSLQGGEGFFEVAKDPTHPFIVHTAQADIEVLGTRFNVSAYEADRVVVTLEEGSVRLTAGTDTRLLVPGQQGVVTRGTIAVDAVNVRNYTSWATGVYEYEETTLAAIAQQLSRWYDVDINFANPALGRRRFAGVIFRDQPLQQAVDILSKVSDVRFVKRGETIVIEERK